LEDKKTRKVGVWEADFEDVGGLKLAEDHVQWETRAYNNGIEPVGSGATVPINSCYNLTLNSLFFCLLLYLTFVCHSVERRYIEQCLCWGWSLDSREMK